MWIAMGWVVWYTALDSFRISLQEGFYAVFDSESAVV